jgi:hypothetical protein
MAFRMMCKPPVFYRIVLMMSAAAFLLLPGCSIVGFVANAVGGNGITEDASYKGLAGQKCGVVVWADEGVVDDYRTIQLDTAKALQVKLEEAAKVNVKEVSDITWTPAEQLLQYQENHADMNGEAAEDMAPKLGVSRLIYIEIQEFTTHPSESPDLWRGNMVANVEVIEVADGKAKVAFTERGISVVSPKNCPVEGMPDLNDTAVYASTLDSFTGELGKRFVPHESDAAADPSPSDMQGMQE